MRDDREGQSKASKEQGQVIKAMRAGVKKTQQQLADDAGMHRTQVQRLEAGEISVDNLTMANGVRLAAALEKTTEEFYWEVKQSRLG